VDFPETETPGQQQQGIVSAGNRTHMLSRAVKFEKRVTHLQCWVTLPLQVVVPLLQANAPQLGLCSPINLPL
jgi:hypothetical protein